MNPKENKCEVGIIVLNYNNWKDTIMCLESLFMLDNNTTYHVVVVDNNSTDNSCKHIEDWAKGKTSVTLPEFLIKTNKPVTKPLSYQIGNLSDCTIKEYPLTIIKSVENKGYAAGNNIGIQFCLQCKNDYIWILNNDTVVDPFSLSALLSFYNSNRKIGLLGSKIFYYHSPNIIQGVGGKFNKFTATSKHIAENQTNASCDNALKIDYPIGASIFTSRSFIEKTGLMCEDYFLYFEEIDWVLRGRKLGYETSFCPDSIIFHKEGATTGGNNKLKRSKSELADYYSLRNRLVFTKKHYKHLLPLVYFAFSIVLMNRVLRGQLSRLPKILRILFTHEVVR